MVGFVILLANSRKCSIEKPAASVVPTAGSSFVLSLL